MVVCAVFATALADPEPKKYKPEVKTKDKPTEKNVLTDEEIKFLREVEAKFGVKTELSLENSEEVNNESIEDVSEKENLQTSKLPFVKPPFPAVIAIEIVNDTDTKLNKKRTIDANLGYGYRTNNGYTYSYFGKSGQEKNKFMIYPYSQEDIPPAYPNTHGEISHQSQGHTTTKLSPNVEITPSQAYELVPAEDEATSYNYEKPAVQLNTKYEDAQSIQAPPAQYPAAQAPPSSTLYTTYNGKEFSSLSGQFPQVMSNYLVDPSQLVNNPQYQNAGLTQEHLRSHGANLGQRVVPVLVLRIPSSYIKNPTAELYANLPQNYPLSQYLNHLNLQQLVNEYFRKIGYSYAPQVQAYQSSPLAAPERHIPEPVSHYEPQQYASPYVQPSYTNADYSGVQYSAVQPVMAKYPASYLRQYYSPRGQVLYQQPHQKYLYMYRYIQPNAARHQNLYQQQPQYQQQIPYHTLNQSPRQREVQEIIIHENAGQTEYGTQQTETSNDESQENTVQDEESQSQDSQQYQKHGESSDDGDTPSATPEYGYSTPSPTPDYGPTKVPIPTHHTQTVQIQYEQNPVQKETIAVFHRSQTGHNYNIPNYSQSTPETYNYQSDIYQQNNYQNKEHSSSDDLVLTENYPSKDHTIATVLPLTYKSQTPNEPVQAVSYVTPLPTIKYHSRYKVMVPQTILKNPTNEKVAYVNSHSLPQAAYGQMSSNSEEEYSTGTHYVPTVGKQRSPLYPRNYHAHPKRMIRPESKSDSPSPTTRKNDRSAKKKTT